RREAADGHREGGHQSPDHGLPPRGVRVRRVRLRVATAQLPVGEVHALARRRATRGGGHPSDDLPADLGNRSSHRALLRIRRAFTEPCPAPPSRRLLHLVRLTWSERRWDELAVRPRPTSDGRPRPAGDGPATPSLYLPVRPRPASPVSSQPPAPTYPRRPSVTTLDPSPVPAPPSAPAGDGGQPAVQPVVEVLVHRLDPELPLPAYARPLDAGADLVTAEDVTLGPGERAIVSTGLSIAIPPGYAAFVHPRSGLAARHGLS